MYIDGRRMDWGMAKLGGYVVNLEEEEYFSVELSMHSLGVVYEVRQQDLITMKTIRHSEFVVYGSSQTRSRLAGLYATSY